MSSRTLMAYVLRLYALFFAGIFLVVMAVFLIADFGDRVQLFLEHRLSDVLLLYWNKSLVAAHQLGPAAMMLAGGATVSTLRRRGELTALFALSNAPRTVYLPVVVSGLCGAAFWVAFDEWVVTSAGARVDEISVTRFDRWGDWSAYYGNKEWFRKGSTLFHVKSSDREESFEQSSILSLSPSFELVERWDARRMTWLGGTQWRLEEVEHRSFGSGGGFRLERSDAQVMDLGVELKYFRIRKGRPEQMRVRHLLEQIDARREVGLPVSRLRLALQSRFSYPLTGFAAAMLAVGLALRSNRKAHLTATLVEGIFITFALWGTMVAGKALVLGERVPPALAAWGPFGALLAAGLALWARHEGLAFQPSRRKGSA